MRGSSPIASSLVYAVALAISVYTGSARAITVASTWVAPVSGDWTDPTRWSTNPFYPNNGNPAETTYNALIDVAGAAYTVTLNSDVSVQSLRLRSADALLEHVGGLFTTQTLSAGDVGAGRYHIAGGTLNVNQLNIGARFSSTSAAGEGLFEQSRGRVNNTGPWTYIGYDGGAGTLSISGFQSRYIAAPSGSSLAAHLIGYGSLSRGMAHFRNSASVTLGRTDVGAAGGAGSMLVESGATVFVQGLSIGATPSSSQYGQGTVILSGGQLTIGSGNTLSAPFTIGSDGGSANVIVNGGTLTVQALNHAPGYILIRSAGSFTVNGGAVESDRHVLLAGQFRINGGAVTAPALEVTLNVSSPATPIQGMLMLNGGSVTTHWVQLRSSAYVQAGGTARIGGMHLHIASDAPTLRPDARLSGGTFEARALNIDAGTFTYQAGAFEAGSLTMTGGQFVATPGRDKTVRVGTLSMSGEARLDLADNLMVLDSGAAPPIATIRALIRSGYNTGAWDGPGIMSSAAQITPGNGIGYMQPSPLFTPLLVAYTRYGDANLDGVVNLSDFNALAANFGSTDATWAQGDFNYDGLVNLADFNRLAANFGLSASGTNAPTPDDWSALLAAVPEPTGVAGVLLGAGIVLRRRRRG